LSWALAQQPGGVTVPISLISPTPGSHCSTGGSAQAVSSPTSAKPALNRKIQSILVIVSPFALFIPLASRIPAAHEKLNCRVQFIASLIRINIFRS